MHYIRALWLLWEHTGRHLNILLLPEVSDRDVCFNLYFDLVIHFALEVHHNQGRGMKVAYLVGNRRKLCDEVIVSDLEYADDMTIIADSWEDLTAMMGSLAVCCQEFWLLHQLSENIDNGSAPIRSLTACSASVSHWWRCSSWGSVQDDCGSTSEVYARICKASKVFASLNCILWYQCKIKSHTKLRILKSIIIPTLLGLECVVLLEP